MISLFVYKDILECNAMSNSLLGLNTNFNVAKHTNFNDPKFYIIVNL